MQSDMNCDENETDNNAGYMGSGDMDTDDINEEERDPGVLISRQIEKSRDIIANYKRSKVDIPPRKRFYPADAKGPYRVYIRKLVNNRSIPEISLTKKLTGKYKSITAMRMIVKEKLCVEFSDLREANALPNDTDFNVDYHVYIQCTGVEIQGVVPFSLGESLIVLQREGAGRLKTQMSKKIEIIEVKRLYKVVKEAFKCPNCDGTFPEKAHDCPVRDAIRAKQYKAAEDNHKKLYSEILRQQTPANGAVRATPRRSQNTQPTNRFEALSEPEDEEEEEGAVGGVQEEEASNQERQRRQKRNRAQRSSEDIDESYWSSLGAVPKNRSFVQPQVSKAPQQQRKNIKKKQDKPSEDDQESQDWIDKIVDKFVEWIESFGLSDGLVEMIRAVVAPLIKNLISEMIPALMTRMFSGLCGKNE
ncbi:uncharacterized protein LOC129787665 [Lutzomyia longipalpis]|uniref:uncharacterized protein LOC129787665 n=1 Tax=Lutzomyia longipalpis TaxID=7200 RepID=UPI002483697C|nr:uncharacterized protein LOC129787665 [Lutzomyia longipalpis]